MNVRTALVAYCCLPFPAALGPCPAKMRAVLYGAPCIPQSVLSVLPRAKIWYALRLVFVMSGEAMVLAVTLPLTPGTHFREVNFADELSKHEQGLAKKLLALPLHPEMHRLLLVFPFEQLLFTPNPTQAGKKGDISLALKLEAGKQYAQPAGSFVAQHQPKELPALWTALHHKMALWLIRRASTSGNWGAMENLETQWRAAVTHHQAVSRHALVSPEAYFAETLSSALTADRESKKPPAILQVTFHI